MKPPAPGSQDPQLPKRKHIRLSPEAYKNPHNTFHIVIDALERQTHFGIPSFNNRVVEILRDLVIAYRCPTKIFCLMPTHLHLMVNPGVRSLVRVVGEFKKESADLARATRGIDHLWQRSFFDHRIRSDESEA